MKKPQWPEWGANQKGCSKLIVASHGRRLLRRDARSLSLEFGMDLHDAWEIVLPGTLGPLRLGMSKAEVRSLDHIYGDPVRTSNAGEDLDPLEALSDFAQFFSPDEISLAVGVLAEHDRERQGRIIEYRALGQPTLEYNADLLEAIRIDSRCTQAHLIGHRIHDISPREVTSIFCEIDQKAVILGNSLLFPEMGVELVNYWEADSSAEPQLVAANEGETLRHINLVSQDWVTAVKSRYRQFSP